MQQVSRSHICLNCRLRGKGLKCQILAFDDYSICSAGNAHTHVGSGDYNLTVGNPTAPGQNNWRWCNKCYGLAYAGNNTEVSARGGGHNFISSGNYVLSTATQDQPNWSWCKQCQLLWYNRNGPGPLSSWWEPCQ